MANNQPEGIPRKVFDATRPDVGNLVLERQKNQGVIIGEGINAVLIVVNAIRGEKVSLGIYAPVNKPVDRTETRANKLGAGRPTRFYDELNLDYNPDIILQLSLGERVNRRLHSNYLI